MKTAYGVKFLNFGKGRTLFPMTYCSVDANVHHVHNVCQNPFFNHRAGLLGFIVYFGVLSFLREEGGGGD